MVAVMLLFAACLFPRAPACLALPCLPPSLLISLCLVVCLSPHMHSCMQFSSADASHVPCSSVFPRLHSSGLTCHVPLAISSVSPSDRHASSVFRLRSLLLGLVNVHGFIILSPISTFPHILFVCSPPPRPMSLSFPHLHMSHGVMAGGVRPRVLAGTDLAGTLLRYSGRS